MLFEEYIYFNYQFPEPQYLGTKHTHLAWIKKFIPNNVNTAIDAFAGSQSVAFLFKQMEYKTITNDFLNFNNQIGLALIENKNIKLTNEDLKLLFQPAKNKKDFELIGNTVYESLSGNQGLFYRLSTFELSPLAFSDLLIALSTSTTPNFISQLPLKWTIRAHCSAWTESWPHISTNDLMTCSKVFTSSL